jgi:hypothetical protein
LSDLIKPNGFLRNESKISHTPEKAVLTRTRPYAQEDTLLNYTDAALTGEPIINRRLRHWKQGNHTQGTFPQPSSAAPIYTGVECRSCSVDCPGSSCGFVEWEQTKTELKRVFGFFWPSFGWTDWFQCPPASAVFALRLQPDSNRIRKTAAESLETLKFEDTSGTTDLSVESVLFFSPF